MHVSANRCLQPQEADASQLLLLLVLLLLQLLLLLGLLGGLSTSDSFLYLQRESQNNNAFESVYTFQDLDVPDAPRIRALEGLLGGCVIVSIATVLKLTSKQL